MSPSGDVREAPTVVPTGTLVELSVNQLKPSPHNPRKLFDPDPLAALMESIRKHGVLVPLTVFKLPGQKKYAIVDGERRYRCCSDLAKDGIAIRRAINVQVSDHVDFAALRNVGGYLVPVVNATCYTSEIGNHLNLVYPDSPFAACYFDRADGNRQWSLRSRGEFDVSEVAQKFGGGGHRNSAGYTEVISERGQES